MATRTISINRAPVLTLWAAVVAQRLGFDEDEALTLGKAVAGLNAQAKGRRLGIFKPHEEKAKKAREKERGEQFLIEVLRSARARHEHRRRHPGRARAASRLTQTACGATWRTSSGTNLKAVRSAMLKLAKAYKPKELADHAYRALRAIPARHPRRREGLGCQGRSGPGADWAAGEQ